MKSFFVTLAGLALAGCMTSDDAVNPRGSYPDLGTGSAEARQMGKLEVRTHMEPVQGGKEPLRAFLPRYVVYDENGRRVTEVRNRVLSDGTEEAEAVELPSGRYLVKIDDRDDEPSVFWVTVEPGALTRVDSDVVREAK